MKPPIMICGCPGSGTSLVTKMLRFAGLFVGDDSGPKEARKYHESQCFKQQNEQFLSTTISFPHAPKSVDQFNSHHVKMVESLDQLVDSVVVEPLMNQFWGASRGLASEQTWGWKDPRNSATAMIWNHVFPGLRAIVINRNLKWRDRWKNRGSDSGKWFRKESTSELRELYRNPIGLDRSSVLHVDVDQFTTDADCFAKVLEWCQLNQEPATRFDEFLDQVGFER